MQVVILCNGLGKKPLDMINWLLVDDVSIDFLTTVDLYYVQTSI
jgi:hypothetical protein